MMYEVYKTMRKILFVSSLGAIVLSLFIWGVVLTKQSNNTDIWRVERDHHYYIEHVVGNQSTQYDIKPPKYEGDEDPFYGLRVLGVKDKSLVILGATGRLYAYNTSTQEVLVLIEGIQDLSYDVEKKLLLFCDADHNEYELEWTKGVEPVPTGRRIFAYRSNDFTLKEIRRCNWEFKARQRRKLGKTNLVFTSNFTDEPGWDYCGRVINSATGDHTNLHLPKQWRFNYATMDESHNLIYVAYGDRVVTYHYGEEVNRYPLPYRGNWRLLRGSAESVPRVDVNDDGIESTEEVRNAIISDAVLLVNEDTYEAWAILDGEARLLANDVRDYQLHLGRPDWTGDHATAFFWMNSEGVAHELRWKEKNAKSIILGKGATGISKYRPGFLVRPEDGRWDHCLGGQYVVTIPKTPKTKG